MKKKQQTIDSGFMAFLGVIGLFITMVGIIVSQSN
jgi:Co/Zn/Cd efflux system component